MRSRDFASWIQLALGAVSAACAAAGSPDGDGGVGAAAAVGGAGAGGGGGSSTGATGGSAAAGGSSGGAGGAPAGAGGQHPGGAAGTSGTGSGGTSGGGAAGAGGGAAGASSGGGGTTTGGAAGTAGSGGAPPIHGTPCTTSATCPGTGQTCFEGLCRDGCFPWLDPCDWSPSGNVCLGNVCVECNADSDCPGTRYACDLSNHTCKDQPFDPTRTKIGVFYHTWHCPSATDVHDVTQCLAGQQAWPPWPSDPNAQTSFWWGEPAAGYYCLTNDTALLAQHAQLLSEMGADFVFVDVTNHNYNTGALCDRPVEMILEPFTAMVNVWKGVAGAPKIVPWVPISDCPTYLSPGACNQPDDKYIVYDLLDLLAGSGLAFDYQGKPLLLITENGTYPVSEARLAALSASYTLRKMWAFEPEGTDKWSYLEKCDSSPLESRPCDQRLALRAGAPEQLPIAVAYGADYMSHTSTATPKHYGRTFRKQFETLFDHPETPIATITGWNEWVVGRWKCGSPLCDCSNAFDQTYGCFLDQYTAEYNRDLEPAKTATGDYYYRLAKSCIALFRAGKRCTQDNAADLCCSEYAGPK
ncbi:MAG: hypothetical protein IT376_16710 [Polyangiaceae bacterium]|nr:hypothetical protein [Polyangiaceae bacterium]